MIRIGLFLLLSGALAWLTRASLTGVRSHGLYRLLAWMCIMGLFFLNFVSLRQWFGSPFSIHQVVSWTLMFASIVPVAWGTHLLRTRGAPDAGRSGDPALLAFERTTELVTTGIYRYVRHPLYSSLLLLAWGVFFKRVSWPAAVLALCATGFLLATAKVEEAENIGYFGTAYREYMKRTRLFIPFVF